MTHPLPRRPAARTARLTFACLAALGLLAACGGGGIDADDDPGVLSADLPPLDVAATAFQWRVWDALTRIPVGETRSYGELAAALGHPGAARAVGRACGSNRLAFLVPCHRVVREDGSPGGWRWGVERKRELLARERDGLAGNALSRRRGAK